MVWAGLFDFHILSDRGGINIVPRHDVRMTCFRW